MSGVGGTHSDGFPRKKRHMIRGPPSSLSDLSNAANATLFVWLFISIVSEFRKGKDVPGMLSEES